MTPAASIALFGFKGMAGVISANPLLNFLTNSAVKRTHVVVNWGSHESLLTNKNGGYAKMGTAIMTPTKVAPSS